MRILITGSEGTVGKILLSDLKLAKYQVTTIDQEPSERKNHFQADISDLDSMLSHFKDIDAVFHLAADVRNYINWHSLIVPNLTGTRNVYEAAARNGVKKIIYASSLNVYPWQEMFDRGEQINEDTQVKSSNDYGLLKILSEEIGRDYSKKHGISVVNLRLGSVSKDNRPCGYSEGKCKDIDYSHWLSHEDTKRIFRGALEYTRDYICVPVCSANKPSLVDMDTIEKVLGVRPRSSSDEFKKCKK